MVVSDTGADQKHPGPGSKPEPVFQATARECPAIPLKLNPIWHDILAPGIILGQSALLTKAV